MAIRGLLFDKDGTLLDFAATWLPVLREAAAAAAADHPHLILRLLEACGYDERNGRVRSGSLLAAGTTAEICAAWAEILPGGGRQDMLAAVEQAFIEGGARHAVPVTDLAALVRRLKGRGLRVGVATSDSEAGARASLGPFGILEEIDFLAGYDSGYGGKPGPGMVHGFCRSVGLDPRQTAVVGDNPHDLEMGRRAGAGLKIGVLTGTSSRDELAGLADYVLNSIIMLEVFLDNEFKL